MKKTIQIFLDSNKVAIAGASPNKDNFGRTLMVELQKLGKDIFLVNPRYGEIEGKTCLPTDVLRRGNTQVPSLAQENIQQNSR